MRFILPILLLISAVTFVIYSIIEVKAEANRICWVLDSDEAYYVSCRKRNLERYV